MQTITVPVTVADVLPRAVTPNTTLLFRASSKSAKFPANRLATSRSQARTALRSARRLRNLAIPPADEAVAFTVRVKHWAASAGAVERTETAAVVVNTVAVVVAAMPPVRVETVRAAAVSFFAITLVIVFSLVWLVCVVGGIARLMTKVYEITVRHAVKRFTGRRSSQWKRQSSFDSARFPFAIARMRL